MAANAKRFQTGTLRMPASSGIPHPVETRPQELPIAQITWENFEKLCLRLIEKNADVEQCQLYGERGEEQAGIDIYARRRIEQSYHVYQCKNVSNFGHSLIEAAVTTFLNGTWTTRATTFVLCTRESMTSKQRADAIVAQVGALPA